MTCSRVRSEVLHRPWLAAVFALSGLLWCAGPLATPTLAQTTGSSILDRLQRLQGSTVEPSETPPAIPALPLERPVDPERYPLFPGDQLHLGVWGESPSALYLTVSPEGDLLIPKVGPMRVTGLTLRAAEERLSAELKPVLGRARVTLRLLSPGKFRVGIAGLVTRPGLYDMTGTQRLSDLIDAAGGVRAGGSVRGVRVGSLLAGGQPTRTVDLFPWIVRGEAESNPFLSPGMEVEVPPIEAAVRVRGPVNGRGALQATTLPPARIGDRPEEEADLLAEFRAGDTLGSILEQVGGLSDRATTHGILRRAGQDARVLDLTSEADRRLPLAAGDVLEVGYAARWVFVTGSVRSPGRFPFFSGLHARDYVALAGGPTEVGRQSGWTIDTPDGGRRKVNRSDEVPSGAVVRVPERNTYRLTSWLSPLSTATALIISIVALTR